MFHGLLFFLLFLIYHLANTENDPGPTFASCHKPPNRPEHVTNIKLAHIRNALDRQKYIEKNRLKSNATREEQLILWSSFVAMMQYSNYCLVADFTKTDNITETRQAMRQALTPAKDQEKGLYRCPLSHPFCSLFHKTTKIGTANRTHVIMKCNKMTKETLKQHRDTAEGKEVILPTGYRGVLCLNVYCQMEEAARQDMPTLFQAFLYFFLNQAEEQAKKEETDRVLKEKGVMSQKEKLAAQDTEDPDGHHAVTVAGPTFNASVRFSLGSLIAICICGLGLIGLGYLPKWRDQLKKRRGKAEKKDKKQTRMAHHALFGAYQEKTEAQKRMTQL